MHIVLAVSVQVALFNQVLPQPGQPRQSKGVKYNELNINMACILNIIYFK